MVIVILIICWLVYNEFYFRSKKFNYVKESIKIHISNSNELNGYIEELKKTFINIKSDNVGESKYHNTSNYLYKKPNLSKINKRDNVYNCSLNVCKSANNNPYKYFCKYFNIDENEDNLYNFQKILNNFISVEEGKKLLLQEKKDILFSVDNKIPLLIRKLSSKRLERELGFKMIGIRNDYFPDFYFVYISPGGNSSMTTKITFNIDNLEKFIDYLAGRVKYINSVNGQRALMTANVRKKIKERDNFSCKICGLSIYDEKNLLLEIDHIIPLSKGGMSVESNLQTLCWKCNRKKSNNIL